MTLGTLPRGTWRGRQAWWLLIMLSGKSCCYSLPIYDATHAGGLPLPQTWGEARKFVSVLEDFLKDFPARFGCGHTDRRAALIPQNAKYCRKSMTRKIVLWAQSCSPERAWQDWTAGMLAEVCPDPTGDLGRLNPAQQA